MSKVGEALGVHEVHFIYIHSEILDSSFDLLTTKFWGVQPPLSNSGGAQAPLPPGFSASDNCTVCFLDNFD